METLEESLKALSVHSEEIIVALQNAIKDADKSKQGKPIPIDVSVNPTPLGFEFCIGAMCWKL